MNLVSERYTENIAHAKKQRRTAERKWLKTRQPEDLDVLRSERNRVTQLCHNAKRSFFHQKINENSSNQKTLFNITNELLYRKKDTKLPSSDSPEQLANRFSDYFTSKIETINQSFGNDPRHDSLHAEYSGTTFTTFNPITEEQLKKIVLSGNSKCCHLDPVPTQLLKQVIGEVIPTLTNIVNMSLEASYFPMKLKSALVVPLLKKSTLDPEVEKN